MLAYLALQDLFVTFGRHMVKFDLVTTIVLNQLLHMKRVLKQQYYQMVGLKLNKYE